MPTVLKPGSSHWACACLSHHMLVCVLGSSQHQTFPARNVGMTGCQATGAAPEDDCITRVPHSPTPRVAQSQRTLTSTQYWCQKGVTVSLRTCSSRSVATLVLPPLPTAWMPPAAPSSLSCLSWLAW